MATRMTPASTVHTAKSPRPGLLSGLALGLGMILSACSGGSSTSSGSSGGSLQIVSCSLSCGGGVGGTQISCGLNQVAVNESITLDFNQPINLATVTKNTFQITDIGTGKSPAGTFTLAAGNPKRLIFRPLLTFDASGNPVFGFQELHSYQVLVRGVNQDSGGNFITSTAGSENTSRMFCTIAASGILDPVPGPPNATVTVDVVTATDPVTGEVTSVAPMVASGGAGLIDVWSKSSIRMSFDDIMNPATLVNPVTGTSSTIKVFIDPDGNTTDASDQLQIFGDFTISIDEDNLVTNVTFKPSAGLPSSGSGIFPRVVVVSLPNSIVDLGANPIVNSGTVTFVPQFVPFSPVTMPEGGEQFLTEELLDNDNTGASWGGGALIRAKSGGSGRLGPLVVTVQSSPLILDTDNQVLDGFQIIPEGAGAFPPSATPPSATITDGVFEFSKVTIGPGAQLRFTGSNPARLFARGAANIQGSGTIDVRGASPADVFSVPSGHDSEELLGGVGGAAGPAGGAGGDGGDRPNDTDLSLIALGGQSNPGAERDGQPGVGVGGVVGLASGGGGLAWPAAHLATSSDLVDFFPDTVCKIDMTPGPGAGGGYATSGGTGIPKIVDPGFNPTPLPPGILPPNTPGGDSGLLALTPEVRTLDPNQGFLRGGSGGGGGGQGYLRSQTDGLPFSECKIGKKFKTYWGHSAAAGGGGGGALQLQAGQIIKLDGAITASGGDGASSQNPPISFNRGDQGAPGGGGSGGAILLQAPNLLIADTGDRLAVTGGTGGRGPGSGAGTFAGDGGLGLVRLEASTAPDPISEAKKIAPYDPLPGSVSGGETSSAILSTGVLPQGLSGPEGRSGAQSCWIVPEGNFFVLEFQDDDLSDPMDLDLGWDVDVVLTLPGFQPFSFRDPNDPNNPFGISPEAFLGTDLGGGTPGALVVRFQGVHSIKAVDDVCSVDLADPLGSVDPLSVTPWVRHPAELNSYWEDALPLQPELAAKRRTNMIRFQVIFDGEAPLSGLVAGVTNLRIQGIPD